MKKLNTASKYVFLIAALFVFGIGSAFAQDTKPADEYVNNKLKFSFKAPKDSVPQSSDKAVIYWGRPQSVVGTGAGLMLSVNDSFADVWVKSLASGDGVFIALFANKVAEQVAGDREHTVLKKEAVKVAGFDALKIVLTMTMDKTKERWAVYTIPCPEHKRTYMFMIFTQEEYFDKWFAIAEPSVNSFKILKN